MCPCLHIFRIKQILATGELSHFIRDSYIYIIITYDEKNIEREFINIVCLVCWGDT